MRQIEYTPLNEVPSSTLGAALPEFTVPEHVRLGDRVGVDLQRLGHIARWGGFDADVRLHAYSGETTKTNVSVVGMDDHNTALGGGSSSIAAELGRAEFGKNSQAVARTRPPLSLHVNISEIESRMGAQRQPSRDPSAWASHIDRSLRLGLRDAAWKHLVKDRPPITESFFSGLYVGMGTVMSLSEIAVNSVTVHDGYWLFAESAVLVQAPNALKALLKIRGSSAFSDPVYSAMPFAYADRAAVVSARTRLPRPLVKAL